MHARTHTDVSITHAIHTHTKRTHTIKDNITKPVGEAAATYRLFLCTLVLYICIRRSTQVTLCSANPNAYCAEVDPRGLLEI